MAVVFPFCIASEDQGSGASNNDAPGGKKKKKVSSIFQGAKERLVKAKDKIFTGNRSPGIDLTLTLILATTTHTTSDPVVITTAIASDVVNTAPTRDPSPPLFTIPTAATITMIGEDLNAVIDKLEDWEVEE